MDYASSIWKSYECIRRGPMRWVLGKGSISSCCNLFMLIISWIMMMYVATVICLGIWNFLWCVMFYISDAVLNNINWVRWKCQVVIVTLGSCLGWFGKEKWEITVGCDSLSPSNPLVFLLFPSPCWNLHDCHLAICIRWRKVNEIQRNSTANVASVFLWFFHHWCQNHRRIQRKKICI